MKKIYESLDWERRDVVQLAKKNIYEARKIVRKNKEGIRELINQGLSSKRLDRLSETDKELFAALYFLVYKEKLEADNKTNLDFIKEIFKIKTLKELIHDIELFKKNVKAVIIDPIRKGETSNKEDEDSKPDEKELKKKIKDNSKEKEDEKQKGSEEKDSKKDSEETNNKKDVDNDDDEDGDEDETNDYAKDRGFKEAIDELEKTKNEALSKLKDMLNRDKNKNKKAIQKQINEIQRNYAKRIRVMKKAQAGTLMNPRLRVQQELVSGKSFIERAIGFARKSQMPGVVGRASAAVKDTGKAVGRELSSAKKALGETLPARIAKQIKTDRKARFVYEQLGQKPAERFIYSKNEDEKNKLYQQAIKSKTEKKAKGKGKETTSKVDPAEKFKSEYAPDQEKKKSSPEDLKKAESTENKETVLNEKIKNKVKNNFIKK